jgi:spore coat polysaccharide biosynthesis predicted glycosyltransferase SpsG
VLKKDKYILYFTDYNHKIGFGNYSRSKNLFINLKKEFKVFLIYNLTTIKKIENIKKKYPRPVIIIFDTPQINKQLFNFYKIYAKIIFFDYFGKLIPNYNIIIFKHHNVRAKNKFFVGLKYINLKNKVLNLKILNKKIEKKILISLGGGDIKNQSIRIAKYLIKKGYKVTILYGPTFKSKLNFKDSNLKIYYNSKKYLKIFNLHTNIITNGGSTMFEAVYLNKNVYVLPQSLKEANLAKLFNEKKLIIDYGFNKFYKLNLNIFNSIKKSNQKIVDNKGINRVYKIIKNIYLSYGK